MTSSDNKEQVSTDVLTTENKKNTDNNNKPFSKTTILVLKFTSVFAVVSIIIALYSNQISTQLQSSVLIENKALTAEINLLKQNQNLLQEQKNEAKELLQQAQNKWESQLHKIKQQLQNMSMTQPQQEQEWLLLKARYFLELAQINAHWSDSTPSTVSLLQQADASLGQINQPKIFNIRQIIAKEVSQLNMMKPIDIAGMLSQLDAIQNTLTNLVIPALAIQNEPLDAKKSAPESVNNWKTHFTESINKLGKLIIVRRSDEEIKPLLSPLYESILKESIRLNLKEAQWAILNNNQEVYQLGLKQAIASIQKNFNKDTQNTAALLKQLTNLQSINLVQAKPVVGEALPLLNQLIENKPILTHQLDSEAKGDKSL